MGDIVDEIVEQQYRAERYGRSSGTVPSTTYVFTFVYLIKGHWRNTEFEGSPSEAASHFEGVIEKAGGDIDKIRWCRAYRKDGALHIHPKTDEMAEKQVLKVIERKGKTRR